MKKRYVFWGVFLILAAALVIASQFGIFGQLSGWSIVGGVLLIAWLVSGISRASFVEILLSLALLYLIFQKPLGWAVLSPWVVIIAALLCGGGLELLTRPLRRRYRHNHPHWQQFSNSAPEGSCNPDSPCGPADPDSSGDPDDEHAIFIGVHTQHNEGGDDDHPSASISFGTTSKYIHSQNLQSGDFRSSFGSLEVYLDQAHLAPGGAQLYLECNLGNLKLYVPRNWPVLCNIHTSLANVTNDPRFARPDEALPPLYLSGNVSLGNIEVAYV